MTNDNNKKGGVSPVHPVTGSGGPDYLARGVLWGGKSSEKIGNIWQFF